MSDFPLLLAVADTLGSRLGICAGMSIVGILLILSGIHSVRTKRAEESGLGRRAVNNLLGRDNTYTGQSAVAMGIMRIIMGVAAIIFGIVFIFVGPFLAR